MNNVPEWLFVALSYLHVVLAVCVFVVISTLLWLTWGP